MINNFVRENVHNSSVTPINIVENSNESVNIIHSPTRDLRTREMREPIQIVNPWTRPITNFRREEYERLYSSLNL